MSAADRTKALWLQVRSIVLNWVTSLQNKQSISNLFLRAWICCAGICEVQIIDTSNRQLHTQQEIVSRYNWHRRSVKFPFRLTSLLAFCPVAFHSTSIQTSSVRCSIRHQACRKTAEKNRRWYGLDFCTNITTKRIMEIPQGMLKCYYVMSGHFREESSQSFHSPPIFHFQKYRFYLIIIHSPISKTLKYPTEKSCILTHSIAHRLFKLKYFFLKAHDLQKTNPTRRTEVLTVLQKYHMKTFMLVKRAVSI